MNVDAIGQYLGLSTEVMWTTGAVHIMMIVR
jgi:hypothetical protein